MNRAVATLSAIGAFACLAACAAPPRDSGQDAKLPPFLATATSTVMSQSQTFPTTVSPSSSISPNEYSVYVTVEKYCLCFGPRQQMQIKIKPRLENLGGQEVSISADKLRLAVMGNLAGPWTPNEGTGAISTTTRGDMTYTLVPPNRHQASEEVTDGSRTWATFWSGTTLSPTEVYLSPEPMSGDLVFYIPHDTSGAAEVEALALTDESGSVIGWAPWNEWREHTHPADF
jgi:hypothetical protein